MPPDNCLFTPENCEGLQRLEGKIDDLLVAQKSFTGAFAKDRDNNPDLIGHRAYHEEVIAAARAQTEFWKEMRLEMMRKGVWFLVLIVAGLLALGIEAKVRAWLTSLGAMFK
jgi:hypothetical protein